MRVIASFEAVSEAANSLKLEGVEPTTLAVQERIGGGSFTTVKKHLASWSEQRAQDAAAVPIAPAELLARAHEFGRSLWAMAVAEAQFDVQKVRDSAKAEVAALKVELSEAEATILRLERGEDELTGLVESYSEQVRKGELALVESQTTAARVPQLEQELADMRTALAVAQAELTQKAAETGKLMGELAAVRERVRELTVAR